MSEPLAKSGKRGGVTAFRTVRASRPCAIVTCDISVPFCHIHNSTFRPLHLFIMYEYRISLNVCSYFVLKWHLEQFQSWSSAPYLSDLTVMTLDRKMLYNVLFLELALFCYLPHHLLHIEKPNKYITVFQRYTILHCYAPY